MPNPDFQIAPSVRAQFLLLRQGFGASQSISPKKIKVLEHSRAMASCSSCCQHLVGTGFAVSSSNRRSNGPEAAAAVRAVVGGRPSLQQLRIEDLGISKNQRSQRKRNFSVSANAVAAQQLVDERADQNNESPIILEVKGLKAVVSDTRQEILNGVDLVIRQGEVSRNLLPNYLALSCRFLCASRILGFWGLGLSFGPRFVLSQWMAPIKKIWLELCSVIGFYSIMCLWCWLAFLFGDAGSCHYGKEWLREEHAI